jgi:enoyl-CoA hydratase
MGLANRVVPPGQAREAAEQLAAELASLPQMCLRNDRLSALESHHLSEEAALGAEFAYGQASLADPALIGGLTNFRAGAGRHGHPASPTP